MSKKFAYPERVVRLATSFSGIGAIEYAFKRLGLKTKIVFAGDIDANCKRLILQITKSRKSNGILIFINWMRHLIKARWIYLLVELHVKPFL